MAHDAEFLLQFDPEPYIARGLSTNSFLLLGFTVAELEVIACVRYSPVDGAARSWENYHRSVVDSLRIKSGATEEKRNAVVLSAFKIQPYVAEKIIRRHSRTIDLDSNALLNSEVAGVVLDSGHFMLLDLDLLPIVGEPTRRRESMIAEGSIIPFWLEYQFVQTAVPNVIFQTAREPKEQQTVQSVLLKKLRVLKSATLEDIVESLTVKTGYIIRSNAFVLTDANTLKPADGLVPGEIVIDYY